MNNEHSKIFVSQNDQDYYPEITCGVAALMMLLKAKKIEPLPTYKDLANSLRNTTMTNQNGYYEINVPFAVFPEDMLRFCIQSQLPFRIHFYDDEWKDCLKKAPIMVLVNGHYEDFGPDGHWIVLVDRKNDFFTYLDPWKKAQDDFTKYVSASDFKKFYSGVALQIL